MKRTLILSFFAFFALFAFTGCPSLPPATPSQQAAASAPPRAGSAKVVVYRFPSFRAGAVVHFVYVDGRQLGTIQQGKFMVTTVAPGQHTVASGHESVPFRAEAGRTYYFEGDTHWYLGDQEQGGEIKQVSPEIAKPRLARCQQVISNF